MKSSIFFTNTPLGYGHGGAVVSYNMLKALQPITNLRSVFCTGILPPVKSLGTPTKIIPKNYTEGSPFLLDYFCLSQINEEVNLAVFYAAPFGQTAKRLKPAKIIVDIAPHNIERSREEALAFGGKFPFPHINNPFLFSLYMLHVKIADTVIVHSKSSANYLKKLLSLKKDPTVLPHGVDLPLKTEPLPKEFRVAHVSQFGLDKGQIYLLRAWGILQQISGFNAELVIVGMGTEHLQKLSGNLKRVKCLGYVSDVNALYDKCPVYVQPTVTEGFSLTTLEAMSHSRPVIVTEGAGVSELVEDGKDGFVIPIRSSQAIAEKIKYFYDNYPSEVKRMGNNARKTAEKYTWNNIRKEYARLFYEEVS